MDVNLTQMSNVTTGKIYWSIITKERRGEFLGGTVQVIPHVTNEIKEHIKRVAHATGAEVVIIEIGGTVGDIESLPFLEAIRQMKGDVGRDACLYVHVTLVPYVGAARELKTKPTQHSVKELRSIGIQPDIIVCRSEQPLSEEIKRKIALFCDIDPEAVIPNCDAETIYEVPFSLRKRGWTISSSAVWDSKRARGTCSNGDRWSTRSKTLRTLSGSGLSASTSRCLTPI